MAGPDWPVSRRALRDRCASSALAPTSLTSTVMWLVRLLMRYARPCARGRIRLSVGPSSTYAALTTSAAGSSCRLCSALATALATTLATGSLALCGAKRSRARASSVGR